MKKKSMFLLFLISPLFLIGQIDCKKMSKKYIPQNLEDALHYLDCFWSQANKDSFRTKPEMEAVAALHREYGMTLRNSWGLWRGENKLYNYFKGLGIFHPDDMSSLILVSFHRKLNHKELQLDTQIQSTKDYWEQAKKKETESKRQKWKEYHLGDTLEFNYPYGYISPQQEAKWMKDECFPKGLVLEKDSVQFLLKIRLIEACDPKGIVSQKGTILAKKGKKEKPKEIIETMNVGEERWFYFKNWSEVVE